MKFTRIPLIIEAFKAGYDPIPDWFMDRVTANQIILIKDEKYFAKIIGWNDTEHKIEKGYYVVNSIWPFVVWQPEQFESAFLMGDLTDVYTLGFALDQSLKDLNDFTTIEETYNSLHEDLRDFRRDITEGASDTILSEMLLQLAATALKARKDLYEE